MLVGILTTITIASAQLVSANNYTANDPAAKYHCWATDANGKYNLTAEGNLIPCEIDSGDNAWMLTSSALVLVMTPGGLAIFYAGLTRQKKCC
jgi:Amt family ammonium transporter